LLKRIENKNLKYVNTTGATGVGVRGHICVNSEFAEYVFVSYLSRVKYLELQKQAGSGGGIKYYVNV
jgi:hypothetical protein